MRIRLVMMVVFLVLAVPFGRPATAQGGMTLAAAKLLFGDLVDAGYEPQLTRRNGGYFVSVNAGSGAQAPTAQQVQNFATARSVTARVFAVEFQ